jgi:hypothetical protein
MKMELTVFRNVCTYNSDVGESPTSKNTTFTTGREFEIKQSGTVSSESRCALRLPYVDLVVSIEAAAELCCCFTVFSC